MFSCDGAVFLINNLHQLRTTLSLYPVPESKLTSLQVSCHAGQMMTHVNPVPVSVQDKITASLSVLASAQTSHLMSALGLLTIAPLLAPGGGDGTPLSTVPGMMSVQG